jgi:hypothetical protein
MYKVYYKDLNSNKSFQTSTKDAAETGRLLEALEKANCQVLAAVPLPSEEFKFVEVEKVMSYLSGDRNKPKDMNYGTTQQQPPAQTQQRQDNAQGCADCGAEISDKVRDYSVKKFGRPLCMDCQKKNGGGQQGGGYRRGGYNRGGYKGGYRRGGYNGNRGGNGGGQSSGGKYGRTA